MTIEDVVAVYEAIVKRPGKFEGEKAYCPYFYEISIGGGADQVYTDENTAQDEIEIKKADLELFPELEGRRKAILTYSEAGFVHCDVI